MNAFIEQNKRLLRFYCVAARIIGGVLIFGGFIWFLLILAGPLQKVSAGRGQIEIILYSASSLVFDFLSPGLIALGVTDFITCLLQKEYRPGPILRNGKAFLYLYAAFLVGGAAVEYFWYIRIVEEFRPSHLLFAQALLLPIAAKVLILVGLAQILKRIMPVIEESKTLV